jgi:hypothetical protein
MDDRSKLPILGPKAAIVAAAAPALAAAWGVVMCGRWPGWGWATGVVAILTYIAFPAVVIVALLRRLADWGLPWLGFCLCLFVIGAWDIMGEHILPPQPFGPTSPPAIAGVVVIGLVYAATVVFVARRGWRRAGILSFGIAGMLHVFFLGVLGTRPFEEHYLTLLAIPVGLLDAALIWLYARGSDGARGAAQAVLALVTLGVTSLYWHAGNASPHGDHEPYTAIVLLFLVQVALAVAAPLLAIFVSAARRGGRGLWEAVSVRRIARPT